MLGKSFGVSTAYVTVSMSAFLSLFEVLFPMSQPLTDQPLLELISVSCCPRWDRRYCSMWGPPPAEPTSSP